MRPIRLHVGPYRTRPVDGLGSMGQLWTGVPLPSGPDWSWITTPILILSVILIVRDMKKRK